MGAWVAVWDGSLFRIVVFLLGVLRGGVGRLAFRDSRSKQAKCDL